MVNDFSKAIENATWIGYNNEQVKSCPNFIKNFFINGRKIKSAHLVITAIGVYEARINGKRVGQFILAPGVTTYEKRLQYQVYDVSSLLQENNELSILLGTGWYRGRMSERCDALHSTPGAIRAAVTIQYEDGTDYIYTDETFKVYESPVISSDLYDGEKYDATKDNFKSFPVITRSDIIGQKLIPQDGEEIREQEHLFVKRAFYAPNGELILDFGQNFAGYVTFTIHSTAGSILRYSHAEELDSNGNAYTENYRSAKVEIEYICRDGIQNYKPHFCFMGFRYVIIKELPSDITISDCMNAFEGIALYSNMLRTGYLTSGNNQLNQLYSNTLWSQRSNFIDIPTDCPQRDERLGWTGDAQVFCQTAAFNYNVNRFFKKWCGDLRASQRPDGSIPDTVPNFWCLNGSSTAWGDAICIVPWQMYLSYGDIDILDENFNAMKAWVNYITQDTITDGLWICKDEDKALWKKHYGDWLALDAPEGSYKGSTNDDFIASAFYYHSTSILVNAGHLISIDVSYYEDLKKQIFESFIVHFNKYHTQTEHVLALYFDLTLDPEQTAASLADDIINNGYRMKTGFVGTPYLLHALSKYGYYDLCYALLLQENFPSWMFPITQGATTIWEHWDGKKSNGSFWSSDMNSFNHYAYGSVFDWVVTKAAGINTQPNKPGYQEILIAPHPNKQLGFLDVTYETAYGTIRSYWRYTNESVYYEINTPVPAICIINKKEHHLVPGKYVINC